MSLIVWGECRRRSWPEETREVALRAAALPHLPVHALETPATHGPHRDLIRELFRLQVRMMREHPDVTELVRNRRFDLIVDQGIEKVRIDSQLERIPCLGWCLHRHHQLSLGTIDTTTGSGIDSRALSSTTST